MVLVLANNVLCVGHLDCMTVWNLKLVHLLYQA